MMRNFSDQLSRMLLVVILTSDLAAVTVNSAQAISHHQKQHLLHRLSTIQTTPAIMPSVLPVVELDKTPIPNLLNGTGAILSDAATGTPSNPATPVADPPITAVGTSRPSFTDAVLTVPKGSLQVESGATFTDNRGGSYSWTTPESLFRLGVTNNTELRITTPNYTYIGNNRPGSLANGLGDISVGIMQHVRLPGKVDVSIIPILNIPTGANSLSSNALDPEIRLTAARNITPKWIVSSMIDARWTNSRYASAKAFLTPTFINYYTFTSKLTGFLEYAGIIPTIGKTTQYIQGGALYLLTPRQQVDLRLATGFNKTSPNILVGFGYSFRIDGLFNHFENRKSKTAASNSTMKE